MELDFNKIIRLDKIKADKSKLLKEELVLSEPLFTDRIFIRYIYKRFVDAVIKRGGIVDSVSSRKKFIFIILYLYAPSALVGGKMPKGLRVDISKVLNMYSASTISNNCADVYFLYKNYTDFSDDVAAIFNEIMTELENY